MKIMAITGPTSGIGEETFKSLISDFDQLFLLARNPRKAEELIGKLPEAAKHKVVFVEVDLSDLHSVKRAASKVMEKAGHIDLLVNNAGGIFTKKETTKDKFELTFQANHLGHFLLTQELMPLLLSAPAPKVINVSSEAHRAGKVDLHDLQFENKTYQSFLAYANAKLFNIWFTKSLVDHYSSKGLSAYALHPGVVKTNFAKESSGIFNLFWKLASPFMIDASAGARTSIFLARTKLPASQNGYYFKNRKVMKPSGLALNKEMREKFWIKSMELIKPFTGN